MMLESDPIVTLPEPSQRSWDRLCFRWRPAPLCLLLSFLPALTHAASPPPRLEASEPIWVSSEVPDQAFVEPHLAVHPENPNLLTAGVIAVPISSDSEARSVAFHSGDGGRSWQLIDTPGCGADPWVAYAPDGSVYLSCHEQREVDGRNFTAIRIFRSKTSPPQWEPPIAVPLGQGSNVDQPKMVIDDTAGTRRGTVYLAVGQHHPARGFSRYTFGTSVSTSADGESFSAPTFLHHNHLDQQPFASFVFANGDLGVAFMDYATPEPRLLDRRRSWLAFSADGGASFSLPALIDEQQETELPWAMAVNRSGRFPDRLYAVLDGHWTREPSPPRADASLPALALSFSDNRGLTWSRPVPISRGPTTSNAEVPAIAVSRDGTVGVTWHDTREDPKGECFDVYFAASFDGGRTFPDEIRLTPETSCPFADLRQEGVARRWRFGGDYSGLAAGSDGVFHALWADARAGLYRLWTSRIRVQTYR